MEDEMTATARLIVAEYGDDEDAGPSSYEEAAGIFTEVFGREPEDGDGDMCDLWSHICAAAE